MSRLWSDKLDLTLNPRALQLFQRLIAALCAFEFLTRILFYDQLNGVSGFADYEAIRQYLRQTSQDGLTHLVFFISGQKPLQITLLSLGSLAAIALIVGKWTRPSSVLLTLLWLGLCYRTPFLSHGGDAIIFFTLILLTFASWVEGVNGSWLPLAFLWQITLVFAFAGANKLSGPWLDGTAIELALRFDAFSAMDAIDSLWSPLLRVATLAIPYFEIGLPLLLWVKMTRRLGATALMLFGTGLFFLFHSGTLALVVAFYGVLFYPRTSSAAPAGLRKSFSRPVFLSYILFSSASALANLNILEPSQVGILRDYRRMEARYLFPQKWSFMTRPVGDLLRIQVKTTAANQPLRTYVVKQWIRNFTDQPVLDQLLIHRRAIYFKHLFWRRHNTIDWLLGQMLCEDRDYRGHELEISLYVGERELVRSFSRMCE